MDRNNTGLSGLLISFLVGIAVGGWLTSSDEPVNVSTVFDKPLELPTERIRDTSITAEYKPLVLPKEQTETELKAKLAAAGERIAKRGERFTLADGTPLLHNDRPVTYAGRPSNDFVRIRVAERMPTHFKKDSEVPLWYVDRGLVWWPWGVCENLGNVALTIRWANQKSCIYKIVAVSDGK